MARIRKIADLIGWAGLISLSSLAAGWTAIFLLLNQQFKWVVVASVSAFLLDAADGIVARKLGKASDFGRQLDSMIDSINYTVVAALMTMQVLIPGIYGMLIGYLILAFGIMRLVLFNVNGYDAKGENLYYNGVVTPHLTLATGIFYTVNQGIHVPTWIIAIILVTLALGQISTIRIRKTGALAFWLPASIAIAIGAIIWL